MWALLCAYNRSEHLSRTVEELQSENYQLQSYMEASDAPNVNGKRQMTSIHRLMFDFAVTNLVYLHCLERHNVGANPNSSPGSVVAPIGPDRLTIPPNQQRRGFSTRQHHSDDIPRPNTANRPGSRRFAECVFVLLPLSLACF